MEALFWWAEDAEYCEWRIPRGRISRVRSSMTAVVHHDAIRQGGDIPTWKYYYESRNMLYYHLHVMHRVGRYPKKITSLGLEGPSPPEERSSRMSRERFAKGFYDGLFGRLGIRYEVSSLRERDLHHSPDP